MSLGRNYGGGAVGARGHAAIGRVGETGTLVDRHVTKFTGGNDGQSGHFGRNLTGVSIRQFMFSKSGRENAGETSCFNNGLAKHI